VAAPLRRPRSSETRAALIDAAARVFVERGFHGATVREIAQSAGYTNPVLYYHFAGKEELYEAVIRAAFERFQSLVSEALESEREPLARLHAIAEAQLRFGRDDPVRLRLLYAELFRPRAADPDPDLGFQELRNWMNARIEAVLRDGVGAGVLEVEDGALARRIFVALLGGLLVEQARDPKVRILDASLARTAVETFLHGISSPVRPS
jgi:AcrR family transcriptional regulator